VNVETHRPASARLRTALLALALFAGALLLYRVSWRETFFDDGPWLAAAVGRDDGTLWYHVLVVPLARAVRDAIGATNGVVPLQIVSSVAGAITVVAIFALARWWGLAPRAAGVLAALFAVSPALWYQASLVELHALHAAAVSLATVVVVHVPWQRRGAAAFATCVAACAIAAAVAVLAHRTSAVLGLGWLVLSAIASRRAGVVRPLAQWVFVVGPVYLAAVASAYRYGQVLFGAPSDGSATQRPLDVFEDHFGATDRLTTLVVDWLLHWPAIVVLAAVGVVAAHERRREIAALVVSGVLPLLVLFTAMSVPSRGGYALSTTPFVALAAAAGLAVVARRLRPLRVVSFVGAALVVHVAIGAAFVFDAEERAEGALGVARAREVAELLPSGGTLLACDASEQLVCARLPQIRELPLTRAMPRVGDAERQMEILRPMLLAVVAAEPGRVVWDRIWRTTLPEESTIDERFLIPIEALLREACAITERTFGDREYWVLAPRAE